MPTYVYQCPEHGQFDVIKPMADSGREEICPVKKGDPFKRQDRCDRVGKRIFTAPAGLHMNPSGDGYFFNKKTGARSAGRGQR